MSDKEKVRAIQELRRRAGPVDRRLPRTTAEREALEDQDDFALAPSPGHQFHFSVTLQPNYTLSGDSHWFDSAEVTEPFTVSVRAFSLSEACMKAAELPLAAWKIPGDGEL